MMLQQPEKSHGQNTTPQNSISISDNTRKVRAPCVDQDRQGCSRQEDQFSTGSSGSAGEASRRQQASSGHRDADEA
jgi:hypothetical protein